MKHILPDNWRDFYLQPCLETPVPELISGLLSRATKNTEDLKPTRNLRVWH